MLALLLIAPILGIDNFAAAASIGLAGWNSRTCLRMCLVFGVYAAGAPGLGLFLGEAVARDFDSGAGSIGGVVLILVGSARLVGLIHRAERTSVDMSDVSIRSLVSIGFAVSLDSLAAGFGLGLFGVQIPTAIAVIALATVLMTVAGFRLAGLVAMHLGRHGERLSAAALLVVGVGLMTHVL